MACDPFQFDPGMGMLAGGKSASDAFGFGGSGSGSGSGPGSATSPAGSNMMPATMPSMNMGMGSMMPGMGMCGNGSSYGGGTPAGNTGLNQYSSTSNIDPNGGQGAFAPMCGSTKQVYKNDRDFNDPLGINMSGAMAPTGGPEMRASVYDAINRMWPGMSKDTGLSVNTIKNAAANPGYGDASNLARATIDGGFLNGSPQLDTMIDTTRSNAMADTGRQIADQNARTNEDFSRAGEGLSTANQEAQNNSAALERAKTNESLANMEAGTRYQNYATERQNQNQGVNMLNEATGAPINYLSQVNAAKLQPLSAISQMISGLSGGASTQYRPQDVVEQDGYLRSLTKDIGSL